jgi:hypothetical protein
MAIPLMSGFQIGGSDSVDSRLVLTKAEMLAMKDSGMPDTYFCTDKETGEIYTYNKTNTVDPTTGKFRKFTSGVSPEKKTIVKTFSGNIKTGGFVTNGGKDYYFTINVPCQNIKKVILDSIVLTVRENNAYLIGTASGSVDVTSQTKVSTYGDSFISVVTQLSAAPASVVNNNAFGVQCVFTITIEYEDEIVCIAANSEAEVLQTIDPVMDYKVYEAKTELQRSISDINNRLGTQVTYSLSGTTLTITTK